MPASTASSKANEITATRLFDAPRELVWKMWTDPKHVVHWWGPRGFRQTIQEMDVRPGGHWRFILHGPDGTDYKNDMVYREIVAPERLRYSHLSYPPFDATATFSDENGKTRVDVLMEFESAEVRDHVQKTFGAVEGLQQTLDRLGERVADFPFIAERVFAAPRELVFRVWTEKEHLQQWWGPKGVTVLSIENDLRPGGIMHYGLQSPDGMKYFGRWVYREVTPPERLVFVTSFSDEQRGITRHPLAPDWPSELLSTITFDEVGNDTRVTIEWKPINATEEERKAFRNGFASMEQGWGGTLDQLGEYLSK